MIFSIALIALSAFSGFYPPFQPPAGGIGSQTAEGGVRAFSMGGIAAGVPDSGMVSILNPAASAWAENTGFAWGTKFRDTNVTDWSGAASFPDVSVIMPLPMGVQLSAVLSGKSRLNSQEDVTFDNGSGTIDWTGSTAESYIGVTMRASEHLGFSLGGRCFFGSALGDAVTTIGTPGPYAPLTSIYRDDIAFSSAWGINAGAFMKSDVISAGVSIATDRSGNLTVDRDYVGTAEADTTYSYSVPGELSAGVSARVHPRLLVGVDYFARKALTLLDNTTGEGSYLASGFELDPGYGFRVRGGFRTMDGLWRDGAIRYSGGLGYLVSGGKAAVDIGASWEEWSTDQDQSETVFFIGIRASENWLGQ